MEIMFLSNSRIEADSVSNQWQVSFAASLCYRSRSRCRRLGDYSRHIQGNKPNASLNRSRRDDIPRKKGGPASLSEWSTDGEFDSGETAVC